MDTLRSLRALGSTVNTEMIYAFLMGTGWFFLIGWLLALMVAYVKAFRGEPASPWAVKGIRLPNPPASGKLPYSITRKL